MWSCRLNKQAPVGTPAQKPQDRLSSGDDSEPDGLAQVIIVVVGALMAVDVRI